jgi:hypothetical protein
MFGLTALMNAVNRVGNALGGLAETAEQVNAATRQRLQLDPAEPVANRLPEPEESNGRKRRS